MVIYKITNITNSKIYIGKTTRTIGKRFLEHIYDCRRTLGKEIRKYGIENFKIETIDKADSLNSLDDKEKYWISFFNSTAPNGYNLQAGGINGKPCFITREKMSKNNGMKMQLAVNRKRIKCIETGEIFTSIKDAAQAYNLKSKGNIVECCKGMKKHAGKLKDGTRLSWEYINESEQKNSCKVS